MGAVVGGIIGIALAGLIARRLRLIDHRSYLPAVIGGTIGYVWAAELGGYGTGELKGESS